jgi:hypothetical protein
MKLWMLKGIALNRVMSRLKCSAESLLRVALKLAIVHVTDGLDGETAGFLSAIVATHAVGDDGEPTLATKIGVRLRFPIQVGVFVVFALESNVR